MIGAGLGVAKAQFVNFPVRDISILAKLPVRYNKSHSYLTGVPQLICAKLPIPVKYEHDIQ